MVSLVEKAGYSTESEEYYGCGFCLIQAGTAFCRFRDEQGGLIPAELVSELPTWQAVMSQDPDDKQAGCGAIGRDEREACVSSLDLIYG